MSKLEVPGHEMIAPIGEGAMGFVFKAKQITLGRLVAIKILKPELTSDASSVAQFKLEAHSVANLKHPNILQIHEAGEIQGLHYFSMEYVEGYSLSSWINRKKRLAESDAFTVIEAIAQALKYAWDKAGLVHCDIKPDNILIDEDGQIKLADFSGISRTNISDEAKLLADVTFGTPNYMAPEQVEGRPDLDCRVDIYAVGALLYNMLTGEIPFKSYDTDEAMRQQIDGHLKDPMAIHPDIPLPAVQFMERLLVKDRNHRYSSWDDVLVDLARVRAGHAPTGPDPEPGTSTLYRTVSLTVAPAKPATEHGAAHAAHGHPAKKIIIHSHAPLPAVPAAPPPPKAAGGRRTMLIGIIVLLCVINFAILWPMLTKTKTKPAPAPPPVTNTIVKVVRPPPPKPAVTNVPPTPVATNAAPVPATNDTASATNAIPVPPPETNGVTAAVTDTNAVPAATNAVTAVAPVAPRKDDPAMIAAYREYLAVMQDVLRAGLERKFTLADQKLDAWIKAHSGHIYLSLAVKQKERTKRVLDTFGLLSAGSDRLSGKPLQNTPGKVGTLLSIRDDRVTLTRQLGSAGLANMEADIYEFANADIAFLFRTLDPKAGIACEAVLNVAQAQFARAQALVSEAAAAGADVADLGAWISEWQNITPNLAADKAVDDAAALVKAERFADAGAALERLRAAYGSTVVVQTLRVNEIAELAARVDAKLNPVSDGDDFMAVAPDELPGVTPRPPVPVPVPVPGAGTPAAPPVEHERPPQIGIADLGTPQNFMKYDGKIVELRFRSRGNISPADRGKYRADLRSDEGVVSVIVPEEGAEEIRRVPVGATTRAPARTVFGRVDGRNQRIDLIGARRERNETRVYYTW